jgi:hypothetical protein
MAAAVIRSRRADVVGVALDHVQGPDDHRQQVVEVVGDAAGQLADGFQLLRLEQRRLGRVALGHGRLDPLGQQLVDAGQIGLGLLGFRDVEGDADEAVEGSVRTEARLRERPQPAHLVVDAAIAAFQHERLAAALAGDLGLEDAGQVVGVQPGAPVQIERLLVADAGEVGIGLVDELALAAGLRDPHQGRGAVGQAAESGLAFAHLLLGAATIGDVEVQSHDADRLAGFVALDLAASMDPAVALAVVGEAIFDLVDRSLAHGGAEAVTDTGAVFGMGDLPRVSRSTGPSAGRPRFLRAPGDR